MTCYVIESQVSPVMWIEASEVCYGDSMAPDVPIVFTLLDGVTPFTLLDGTTPFERI